MRALLDAAAAWFLGAACPTCGADAAGACAACRAVLGAPEAFRVPWAAAGVPVVAAHAYEGVWASAVVAIKERGSRSLTDVLAGSLACAVAEVLAAGGDGVQAQPVVLVPMPSRATVVRERGLDTTALLARRAASLLDAVGLPARSARVLAHTRRVTDQSGLTIGERRRNLRGALRARRQVPGTVIIIDDLVTTGASLAEAVRALQAEGMRVAGCGVLCAALRRHPEHPG